MTILITKKTLESAGACTTSINHFINVLGNGNPSFSMEYKTALKYLIALSKAQPEEYKQWPGFLISIKDHLKVSQ
jgi:hypothetical protein